MERFSYKSHEEYVQAQLNRTETAWFCGRRLPHHMRYINELLKCLINLNWPLPQEPCIVCMGVRRGIELIAWEWKGYRNVVGTDLSTRHDHPKMITADFSHLESVFPKQSVDIIYACHSFEHTFDPEATAREWRRILKPNGVVWISLPTTLGKRYQPNEVHPVVIHQVADLENLFNPLRAVWVTTEGFPKGGVNINVVLLDPSQRGPASSRNLRRDLRRRVRKGVRLSRLVRRLSRMLKQWNGPDQDYEVEICLWMERLRGFLSGRDKVSLPTGVRPH